jgi:hypothetical protein
MIKASHIIESISQIIVLNERNIINTDQVDAWVDDYVKDTNKPEIKKWLQTRLRKYIINDMPGEHPLTKADWEENPDMFDEPWMVQALDRGETLYYINLDGQEDFFNGTLPHILDYFEYILSHNDVPWDLQIRDLTSISVEDAIEKSQEWTKWLNKTSGQTEGTEGVREVLRVDGYRWVELTTQAALDYEGNGMGHCVRSYGGRVERGECRIFSLRDSSNEPHVTIEISDNEMKQIQGKQNKPPIEKYWGATVEFLNYGLDKGLFQRISSNSYLYDIEAIFYKGRVYNYDYETAPPEARQFLKERKLKKCYTNNDLRGMKSVLETGVDPSEVILTMGGPGRDHSLFRDAMTPGADDEILRLMIKYVKDVDIPDDYGRCAFYATALNLSGSSRGDSGAGFYIKILKLLLEYGANIDRIDPTHRKTALEASTNSMETSLFLVRSGADIEKTGGALPDPLVFVWSSRDYYNLVLEALDRGIDVNIKDGVGCNLLFDAVARSKPNLKYISELLKRGIDINSIANKVTPLQYAAYHGAGLSVLELLLKNGADPDLGDPNYLRHSSKEIVDLFRRYGAKI